MPHDSAHWQTPTVLSVIIPVYNEAQTIGPMLNQVVRAIPEVAKQVVIVDDCSKDGTSEWLRRNLAHADGLWHTLALNDDSELELSADGPQNAAGFWFAVLFHERN